MKFTAQALFIAATLSLLSFPGVADSADTKAATEAQLETVNEDIQHLRTLLDKLNRERSSTEKQLHSTEKQMNEVQGSIRNLEKRHREGQSEIKKLQRRQQALMAKKESEKDRIASSIHSVYLASRDNKLKLLLNQENPEELSRQLAYLKYLQEAQLDAINQFEQTLAELDSLERQQNRLNVQLQQQRDSLKEKRTQLARTQAERKKLISDLNKRYSASGKQLGQLDEQKLQLETILSQLASRAEPEQPIAKAKGKLPWPVSGRVLYKYNERRPGTRMRWQGTLIAAEPGTRVNAVHDGTVIFSDWLRGYGQLSIVDHGDNYLTLYAHNQWLLKKEGESVLAGEALALSGQSGGQEKPGVYFEVRHNGTPQNPHDWLGSGT
ncbi:MAG: murein hydrolase activator EnvC family protein [Endozoicomonas sp.]